MVASISIEGDLKKLTRHLNEAQRKVIPTVAIQSINFIGREVRKTANKQVAKELRLPLKFIRSRFDLRGNPKGDRTVYHKATRSRPVVLLRVHHRGLPVFQIVGATTRRGLKARGNRLYKNAFLVTAGKYQGFVFQRRDLKNNRSKLMVPKVGMKAQLEGAYDERLNGPAARQMFRRDFSTRLAKRLSRIRTR